MLVSRRNKCLVLRVRDPNAILSVIPSAKPFSFRGKDFVAVRHGPDETKVLRNMGFPAPSPILYHYKWPGQFKPFEAQREAAAFTSLESRAFNLSDLGTGKTLATLWAYDYLRQCKLVRKALVITPLSTLDRTWADEVFTHFPHLDVAVLYGSRSKRIELLNQDVDIFLINHDGIKVPGFVEALKDRNDIDLIIIDEIAQVGRNSGTDRFRALNQICNKQVARKVWGLTGTPTPNDPTDAWAQCRLLVPERVPPYFNRFKNTVMRQINQFLWLPRDNALDVVHDAMQPSIRFTRDECIDLPPLTYTTRSVELTPQQKKAYKDMMNTLCIEAAEGKITAANEAVKAQKLIQVASGAVYGSNGGGVKLDVGPRIDALMEIIEESGSKVIVFVPFVVSVKEVAAKVLYRLNKSSFTKAALQGNQYGSEVEVIYGDVSKNERDRIFTAFQKNTLPRVLVAQPGAMSHGLTLTAASTIVWFAPISSNETFVQANARITRPGQKLNQLIVMIEGTEIERKYYTRLKNKQKVQGLLLDMVKESREEYA